MEGSGSKFHKIKHRFKIEFQVSFHFIKLQCERNNFCSFLHIEEKNSGSVYRIFPDTILIVCDASSVAMLGILEESSIILILDCLILFCGIGVCVLCSINLLFLMYYDPMNS